MRYKIVAIATIDSVAHDFDHLSMHDRSRSTESLASYLATPTKNRPGSTVATPPSTGGTPAQHVKNISPASALAENNIDPDVLAMLLSKSSQVGKITYTHGPKKQPGLGGGLLVGPNLLLCSKHSVHPGANLSVTFGEVESTTRVSEITKYSVTGVLKPDDPTAQDIGLLCGSQGDMCILVLDGYPGGTDNFTPIKVPDAIPDELYFMGYSNGRHLKVSSGAKQTLLTDSARQGIDLSDRDAFWNKDGTSGTIKAQDDLTFHIVSHRGERPHSFTVEGNKVLRKNGHPLKDPVYVRRSPHKGIDHIILSHVTSRRSSGGAYFDRDGNLLFIHRGEIDRDRQDGPFETTDPTCVHHIGVTPWNPNLITFFDDYLVLEEKAPVPFDTIVVRDKGLVGKGFYRLKPETKLIGQITSVAETDTTAEITILTPDGRNITFSAPYYPTTTIITKKGAVRDASHFGLTPHNITLDSEKDTKNKNKDTGLGCFSVSDISSGTADFFGLKPDVQREFSSRLRTKGKYTCTLASGDTVSHASIGFANVSIHYVYNENDNDVIVHAVGKHSTNSSYSVPGKKMSDSLAAHPCCTPNKDSGGYTIKL